MHSKSDNIVMIYYKADEVIKELFESLLSLIVLISCVTNVMK